MTATEATGPPSDLTTLETELADICQRLSDVEPLKLRKVELFKALRLAGVTQARIGEIAGMTDVGVVLAIQRHDARTVKAAAKAAAG